MKEESHINVKSVAMLLIVRRKCNGILKLFMKIKNHSNVPLVNPNSNLTRQSHYIEVALGGVFSRAIHNCTIVNI